MTVRGDARSRLRDATGFSTLLDLFAARARTGRVRGRDIEKRDGRLFIHGAPISPEQLAALNERLAFRRRFS